jgi:hypothetical protein
MFNGKMEEKSSLGEKFACWKEREADARRVQPIGWLFWKYGCGMAGWHMQEGRILLRLGLFSARK